jgi:hypothetical protein
MGPVKSQVATQVASEISDWKSCVGLGVPEQRHSSTERRIPSLNDRLGAGWSSPVARWAHNPKVAGSNPAPATNL